MPLQKIQSVCIQCGEIKTKIGAMCRVCKFKPKQIDDKAKSLILSSRKRYGRKSYGSTQEDLRSASRRLMSGQQLDYDASEIDEAKVLLGKASSVTSTKILLALLKIFWPLIVLFAGFGILLAFLH